MLVKRAQLMKDIKAQADEAGVEWTLVRQGANHEVWQFGSKRLTIPRHNEIGKVLQAIIQKQIAEGK